MDCNSGCGGCSTSVACPCPSSGNPDLDTLEKVINCFWQNHQQLDVEKVWYSGLESLEQAVHEAALALADENVDLDHVPARIALTELATAKQRLCDSLPRIEAAQDFDELLSVVKECLEDLNGIHAELIFLTALRIGMQKGLEPRSIYLHGETLLGASQLVDLSENEKTIERNRLPGIFQHPDLPLSIVQGCLAVCRNQLQWLRDADGFSGS